MKIIMVYLYDRIFTINLGKIISYELYLYYFFIILLYNNYLFIMMINKYLVEFLGSIFFLYMIIATGNAIAIGAALAIAIMLGGHISGGHFNSAVTVMMAAAGKIPMSDAVPYILAQVAGGLVALEIHKRVRF